MRTLQRMIIVSTALFAVSTLTNFFARLATAGKPAPPAPYVYTDLRGFTDGTFMQSEALGISDPDADGIVSVAGSSYVFPSRDEHPVLWEATSTGVALGLHDLGTNPGVADAFVGLGFVSNPGIGLEPLPALGGPTSWA